MRQPTRRTALAVAVAALAASVFASRHALGEARYPSQTIKFVVPYAAGGLPDTVARIVARRMQEQLGEPVIVENRPGANGSTAAAALAAAPADGYLFIVSDCTILTINPLIYARLPYKPRDLTPVAMLARAPLFLAIHPKVPARTFEDFVAYARAHPGELNYGSSGVGSVHHLTMEAINGSLHLSMTHIPFKGVGESVPALIGGHIDVSLAAYPALSGAGSAHQIRLLASTGAKRSTQAPELPAIAEHIPGFDLAPKIGIFARAGTPPEIISRIAATAIAVAAEEDTARQLKDVGIEPAGVGTEDFAQAITREIERVSVAVRLAGLAPQ